MWLTGFQRDKKGSGCGSVGSISEQDGNVDDKRSHQKKKKKKIFSERNRQQVVPEGLELFPAHKIEFSIP